MTKHYILFLSFTLIFLSCSVTKRLQDDRYLLSSNDLEVTYADTLSKKYKIDKGTIKGFIPENQIPNTKFFGYNLSVRIFQMANPESNSWGNRILRKLGQSPVLFDSTLNAKALRNIKLYMDSEGYYNAKVTDTIIYKDKRANVTYKVNAGAPYFISSYKYNFADSAVMPYVLTKDYKSSIKNNMILKRSLLENERLRITNTLQNDGFYYFSVGSVDYLVDTTASQAEVTININKRVVDRVKTDHRRYKIGDIKVSPSDRSMVFLSNPNPTINNRTYDSILYAYPTTIRGVRPKVISKLISLSPGDLIVKDEVTETKNKLNGMSFFRTVNIGFKESPTNSTKDKFGTLDCDIQILQELKQGFKAEAEVATNSNYSGFSLTLGYTNKNIFRGGESLNLSVTGGYDFMHGSGGKDSWEIGGNATLSFPRFIAPFRFEKIKKLNSISTEFEALINSQRRPYYDRIITTLSYGYSWHSGKKFSYSYRPITVSLINVPWKDPGYVDSLPNPYLKASYESQLVAGSNFSIYFKDDYAAKHVYSVRSNLESSGNILYVGSTLFKAKEYETTQGERYYDIFNTRYSQYLRGDITFTYEFKASKFITLAYRLYGGGGYSYGNSSVMPIERQFYAGGGSSMRGWQVRTLGPGNTPERNDLFPNQLGNIRLETNLEARFPIYKIVHGAIFFDLGNIWQNVKGETNESARFYFNKFYNQLAFNTGAGLRLDFDFFVVRMDWGIQLHNPGWQAGHRWINKFDFNNTALHFGIGYPF